MTKAEFIRELLRPERQASESFENYKKRRANGNAYVKQFRKGVLFWDSTNLGTYRKPA